MRHLFTILAATCLATSALAQDEARPTNDPQDFLKTPPRPARIKGPFKLTLIGDLLYSYPAADKPDPEMQKVFAYRPMAADPHNSLAFQAARRCHQREP